MTDYRNRNSSDMQRDGRRPADRQRSSDGRRPAEGNRPAQGQRTGQNQRTAQGQRTGQNQRTAQGQRTGQAQRNLQGQKPRSQSAGSTQKQPLTEEERRRRAQRKKAAQKRKRKKALFRLIAAILIIVIIAVAVILIVNGTKNKKTVNNEVTAETPLDEETTEEVTTKPERHEVTLLSVGDVLMHTPLLNFAAQGDGTYDFNNIFSATKDVISSADIAICNQETPIDPTLPADGGAAFIFNTPPEIADAEINAGFDVVLQSSNHSYDMGPDGILNTIEFWKGKADKAMMIGLNASEEERDTIHTYEKNGITFAMLNYTYGLNGFVMPDDMQYLTTLIDDEHHDMIVSDIKKAKEMADFVIVFPHWGVEDLVGDVTEFQEYWGQVFTEAGADLIIGTHPHVCEKIEWIEAGGNKALCYYSLGNFASNQQELPEVLCGMARVKIIKEGDNCYIDESYTGVTPVVTHNINMGGFTNQVVVYQLSDYTEDMALQHDIRNNYDATFSKENLNLLAENIFGDWIKEY